MRLRDRRGRSLGETACAFFRANDLLRIADEVDGAGEILSVDDDLDLVAVLKFADGATGERFGGDVPDAGAGGDAAEARVGEHGDVLAEGESLRAEVI